MPKKRKKPTAELTADEERFVEEYLIDRIGTTAYLRANPGVKRTTASTESSKLLGNPKIKAAVKAGTDDLSRRSKVSAELVVEHAARIAFLDIGDVLDLSVSDFRPLPPREIPQDVRRAIQSVKVTRRRLRSIGDETYEVESVEYKLPDKNAALDKLMRHLGLYQDLPALEVLLAALPPDVAASVRAALAAQVHGSGDRGHGSTPGDTGTRSATSGPDVGDAGSGTDPGPVAGAARAVPGSTGGGPLHKAIGQDEDGGGEGHGPLLDAPE